MRARDHKQPRRIFGVGVCWLVLSLSGCGPALTRPHVATCDTTYVFEVSIPSMATTQAADQISCMVHGKMVRVQ